MAALLILSTWRRSLVAAGLGTGWLLASATSWGASTPSLETRVRQLEDREEIRELLIEYGHRLDTHDGHDRVRPKERQGISLIDQCDHSS